ncbi:hypothetical protein [Mucilaginibacter sp. CSA2-8R]|uniref:hypothetical protein n=1 Tax=Mucilaginibacter sp. CSA2-8R TaxID=3141542 RepID=UPI00315C6D64
MLKYLLVALCLGLSFSVSAQQLLKGRVFENKTRVGLTGISVQNLNNKQSTVTDNNGKFSIGAKVNDLLLVRGFAYQNDTVLVTKLNETEIFLLPQQHMLADVKVTSAEGPSMAFYDPYYHGQTTTYQRDAAGNIKGGLTFRLHYFKKDERRKAKREKEDKVNEVQLEIDRTFTPKALAKYLPLKGQDMDAFINLYKPAINTYTSNNFVLIDYLNGCYKKFIQLTPEKRLIKADSATFKP